jgi:hypothetical protein
MHQVAKQSWGALFWLWLGCSPVAGDGTHQSTAPDTDESSGATDAINGSGGTNGSGGAETLGQGGDMSAVGGARPPTASTGGTSGSAGAAGTAVAAGQANETFERVLVRFCELSDVLDCTPECLDDRRAEAVDFRECKELYRLLMACQIELPAGQRVCRYKIVTSPNHCTRENTAYADCVKPPANGSG